MDNGFDDRFWTKTTGAYGFGAYFADDINYSDHFAKKNLGADGIKFVFVCKVLLGKQ